MNMRVATLVITALLLMPAQAWGQTAESIEFGQGRYFLVQVSEGKVVGGVARDQTKRWRCVGGAYDGKNLVATFVTDQDHGCGGIMTYNFEVHSGDVLLRSTMNKCGAVEQGTFTRFPRTQ